MKQLPNNLVFLVNEDNTISILIYPDDINLFPEGIDVEKGTFSFYDFEGREMQPVFDIPNKMENNFFISFVSNGRYHLKVLRKSSPRKFLFLLEDDYYLNPNNWFESTSELKQYFSDKNLI